MTFKDDPLDVLKAYIHLPKEGATICTFGNSSNRCTRPRCRLVCNIEIIDLLFRLNVFQILNMDNQTDLLFNILLSDVGTVPAGDAVKVRRCPHQHPRLPKKWILRYTVIGFYTGWFYLSLIPFILWLEIPHRKIIKSQNRTWYGCKLQSQYKQKSTKSECKTIANLKKKKWIHCT